MSKQITEEQTCTIESMLEQRYSKAKIARVIGIDRFTLPELVSSITV